MRLRKVEEVVAARSPAGREILARCRDLLVQALAENRRIAHGLRPTDLDELGLTIACHNFCKEFRSRTNLAVRCHITRFVRRLDPAVELNLFRVVQEAFGNIEAHARAKQIHLRISRQAQAGLLQLKIVDDGRGFDPNAARPAKGRRRGLGLTHIRERAASLGGTCEIESVPGRGTSVTVRIPWPGG
jgi:signal transduction histidine kinase